MPTRPSLARSRPLALAALLLVAAPSARAYNEAIHAYLTRRAFAPRTAWLAEPLAAPTNADLDAFRARFWQLASQAGDASLRAQFLARFPSAASLDAWSFKELLMLDPAARVHGLDPAAPAPTAPELRGALLPLAARWPDDDRRNQSRYQRGPDHQPLLGPDGKPLPYDPMTLALGSLSGIPSQGHAHYGLLPPPRSDDPEVLKRDPRHFSIPPDAESYGAQFAQLYTDLALVAHGSGLPSRGWLEAAFAGASFHHLEDVANQIHTIQVGIYDFFEAAFLQSKLRDLRTLGGLLGERATLRQLGLRLVANHHLLLEDLFARRVAELEAGQESTPALRAALADLERDEPGFAQAARGALEQARRSGKPPIEALANALIDLSSQEGPDCYRLIWQLSAPTLHDGLGYQYDGAGDDDPDRFVRVDSAQARESLEHFYALEAKGLRRATTAVRLWQESFDAEAALPGADQRAVERALAMLLPYHRAAAARAAAYHPESAAAGIAWGYPLAALLLLVATGLLLQRLRRPARSG